MTFSAMPAAASTRAGNLGKDSLQLEVRKSDDASRSFLERRGFERVGGEEAVSLSLSGDFAPPKPPEGIEIVPRRERPDAVEPMYEVFLEAVEDVPGAGPAETIQSWRGGGMDGPSRPPGLAVLGVAGGGGVGYAVLHL